jgi:hypothetical protein
VVRFEEGYVLRLEKWLFMALLACGCPSLAQTVSPVIVQYKEKASGRITLVNNTLAPMVVVLEPKSFSITPQGNGEYRPLDPSIHLQLSAMSFRIEPGQTYYVFYKARADKLPAWFTIYAVFSGLHHEGGLNVRILLPHTVYLYPKRPLAKEKDEIYVNQVAYIRAENKVVCDIENNGPDLQRVQEVRITSSDNSQTAAGFPLLPGGKRHLEISWTEKQLPQMILLQFPSFVVKEATPIAGP